jgi:hypothetical protein
MSEVDESDSLDRTQGRRFLLMAFDPHVIALGEQFFLIRPEQRQFLCKGAWKESGRSPFCHCQCQFIKGT